MGLWRIGKNGGEEYAIENIDDARRFFGNERVVAICHRFARYYIHPALDIYASLKGMQIEVYVYSPNNWTLSGIGNTNKFM